LEGKTLRDGLKLPTPARISLRRWLCIITPSSNCHLHLRDTISLDKPVVSAVSWVRLTLCCSP